MEQSIHTPREMQQLGSHLATDHPRILLQGELAAGKTTFTKGFASAIGIDPEQVKSPTYTYLQIYNETLLHIDMWRIESAEHLHELGIIDMIDSYEYVIIERPKFIDQRKTDQRLSVTIEKKSDAERLVTYSD